MSLHLLPSWVYSFMIQYQGEHGWKPLTYTGLCEKILAKSQTVVSKFEFLCDTWITCAVFWVCSLMIFARGLSFYHSIFLQVLFGKPCWDLFWTSCQLMILCYICAAQYWCNTRTRSIFLVSMHVCIRMCTRSCVRGCVLVCIHFIIKHIDSYWNLWYPWAHCTEFIL